MKKIHNKSGSVTGKEPSKPTNNAYGEYNRIPSIKYGNTDGTETVESWNCHPDCPIGILDDQSGITSTGDTNAIPYTNTTGKNVYGKQTGIKKAMKGDTGGASRFFYCAKTSKAERGEGNTHPTVKPMDLIRYLVTLTSPPRDAHILDPFIGSGTLALVCEKLDITYTGIDLDCDIAIDRIKDATRQMKLF